MRYSKCQSFFDIYVENPEVCNLLVLLDNDSKKVKARALIWTLRNGKKVMDRIYSIDSHDVLTFNDWAKNNNVYKMSDLDINDLIVILTKSDFNNYPYMDNLKKLNIERKTLSHEDLDRGETITLEDKKGIAYRTLKQPHITEKATLLAQNNQYVFIVYNNTNKIEIRKAVEELYNVKVIKVQIVKIIKKRVRVGKTFGWRKGFKKAIVRIKEGQKIEEMIR
jgi:large subunit ribosomal protein L23